MVSPDRKLAASDARNKMPYAISSGRPARPTAFDEPATLSGSRFARSIARRNPSDATAPTAMQLTRTPPGVHAPANVFVRLFTPALAAPYGATKGNPSSDAPDEMLTIVPAPRSSMCLDAATDRTNTLRRFRSIMFCHLSSVHCSNGNDQLPPALLTRMSSRP